MAELINGKEAECTVPHTIESTKGYQITAKCENSVKKLQVTGGHLIFTQRGLQAAAEITTKDTLFEEIDESKMCSIESIEKRDAPQKYFGLNCHNSNVIANGIKSSTFEKLHGLPSFWMSVLSKIVGVKRASSLGGSIEKVAQKMGLVQ